MRSTDVIASRNTSRGSWWTQAMHNRLIALVLAMIVIVPLVASPAGHVFRAAPALALEGFALFLATALLWRARWDISREWVISFLRTSANLPVLLLMVLAIVSCAMAPHKAFAVQGTLQLAAGVLLYFVVAYQFRQSKHLFMMADTLLFLAAAVAILTMGQYTMDPATRGTTLYGNQQPLGSLLMILLPIVASVAVTDKKPNRKLAAQGILAMTGGGLLLAQTRSAWLGAVAGLLVLGLLLLLSFLEQHKASRKHKARRKDRKETSGQHEATGHHKASGRHSLLTQKHKLVVPVVLTIILAGFFVAVATQNSSIVDRASTLSNILQNESLQQRREVLWRGALAMIRARPVTGWGIGQYPLEQHRYTQFGMEIREGGVPASLAENAHNFYLQTAAELGVPGLLLVLAVLFSFLVAAVRHLPHMAPGIRRTLLIGSIAAVVAFMTDALSSPSWQFGQISMFLWLTLGIGTSCLRPRT